MFLLQSQPQQLLSDMEQMLKQMDQMNLDQQEQKDTTTQL